MIVTGRFFRLPIRMICVWAAVVAISADAESVRELILKGNESVRKTDYDAALDAYEKASIEDPESPFLYINRGVVDCRREDYDKAREEFQAAIPKCQDVRLEAKCRYNIGDCFYRECRRQQDSDLQKALEACKSAIEHYQDAARLDPELDKAGRSLEIARLTMKSILDEIRKKQEEQQEQQEQQQKIMEELKKLIERQEQAVAKNDTISKQTTPDKAAESRQATRDLADEQGRLGDDTRTFREKLQQGAAQAAAQAAQAAQQGNAQGGAPPGSGIPEPLAQADQHLGQAVDHQQGATRQLQSEQLKPARTRQEQAADELKKALEALNPPQDDQQQQQQQQQQQAGEQQDQPKGDDKQDQQEQGEKQQEQQQAAQKKPDDQSEKKEEEKKAQAAKVDDRTARDILNDEKRNRERRMIPSGGVTPVDRDW